MHAAGSSRKAVERFAGHPRRGGSMKAYLATTGTVFGLIVLVHVLRVFVEGMHVLTDPWWVGLTAAAAALCIWAFRLLAAARA